MKAKPNLSSPIAFLMLPYNIRPIIPAEQPPPIRMFFHRPEAHLSRYRTALLLALWLIGAQILLAVHQADHFGHVDDNDCVVCLIGHNLNHGGTASIAMPPALVAVVIVIATILATPLKHVTLTPYRARAPPR